MLDACLLIARRVQCMKDIVVTSKYNSEKTPDKLMEDL